MMDYCNFVTCAVMTASAITYIVWLATRVKKMFDELKDKKDDAESALQKG